MSENADHVAGCESTQNPEFLPPDLCGLDPLFHAFNRMYIKDILSMSEYPTLPGAFAYKNHPIFKVDILGVVVKVDKKDKLNQYGVDDGTGVILCCIWKQNNYFRPATEITKANNYLPDLISYLPSSLVCKVQQIKEAMQMDFMLGDLIHIRGKITTFRQIRQITANFAVCVSDPLSEISRMVELPRLYKNVYNKPFQLPSELNKEKVELDAEAIKKKMIDDLTAILKLYLREKQMKLFDVNGILQDKGLHSSVLENSSIDQQFSDPEKILTMAVEAMVKTGEICRRRDKKHTYESLLLPDSEMSAFILKLLRKEKCQNKYSVKGCHIMRVFSEIKKTVRYADVGMSSVRYCLDQLEMNSDIIRSTDSHYVAC